MGKRKVAEAYVMFCDEFDFFKPKRKNSQYERLRNKLDSLIGQCGGSVPDDDEIADAMAEIEP